MLQKQASSAPADAAAAARRTARFLVPAALALLFLLHAGLREHGRRLPMMSDEGEYACQARLLAEGGVPYRDAFNQKPPMVFFLYRAAFGLFGENEEAPRLLATLFGCATLLALFFLLPGRWGTAPRLCAAASFAVLSTEPMGDFSFAANTEVFLCAWLAFCALWARKAWEGGGTRAALLAGLFAGAGLATKQTALWAALALGACAALHAPRGARARVAAAFALGGALVPAAFAAYFLARGGLPALVEQALRRNLDYAGLLAVPGGARMQLGWFARTLAPQMLFGNWPLLLLALFGLAARPAGEDAPLERLCALWLAAALLGALTGLFLFPHYFLPAAPPLALCAALGVRRLSARLPRAALLIGLLAALYPAAAWSTVYFREGPERVARRLLYPNPLYEARAAADFIRENSAETDRVYVFGSEPQLYFRARRRWATPHIFVYPLTLFPRGMGDAEAELARLREAPPRFLVYSTFPASTLVATAPGRRLEEGVRDLLARRYRPRGWVQALPDGMRDELGKEAPAGTPADALLVYERSR
ncbi:MAG: glycosyltransferase family 39 protein [Elusimicrobiota bacterium]|jgi:4-amino-4-deoxy-L-arabinose transferase-like glycosyltransferase